MHAGDFKAQARAALQSSTLSMPNPATVFAEYPIR
jgi:hypothetical protein